MSCCCGYRQFYPTAVVLWPTVVGVVQFYPTAVVLSPTATLLLLHFSALYFTAVIVHCCPTVLLLCSLVSYWCHAVVYLSYCYTANCCILLYPTAAEVYLAAFYCYCALVPIAVVIVHFIAFYCILMHPYSILPLLCSIPLDFTVAYSPTVATVYCILLLPFCSHSP